MVIILNIRKLIKRLTIARSLFKLRNTSCFLINRRSTISVGSSKAYSTVLATYPSFPYWKSLMDKSLGKGAPSNTMEGVQAGTLVWWSPLLYTIAHSLEDLFCVTLACRPLYKAQLPWVEGSFSPPPPPFPFGLDYFLGHVASSVGLQQVEKACFHLAL